MSFHGRPDEAWADWLRGYQRIYPPDALALAREQDLRCGAKPPKESVCPNFGATHAELADCECVLFGAAHPQHRALCGASWPRSEAENGA